MMLRRVSLFGVLWRQRALGGVPRGALGAAAGRRPSADAVVVRPLSVFRPSSVAAAAADQSPRWRVLDGLLPAHAMTVTRLFASDAGFPPHTKIALPALSPTMERGTIVRWTKQEGDQLTEGDLLAEIETDKATMGFEAPEEGYLAKIVVPAGTKDVPLGNLLCIVVTNAADVAAFKNFSASDVSSEAAAAPKPPPPAAAAAATAATESKSYPAHTPVKLPSLSPTMEKGSIQSWMKSEGDELKEGDVIAQIETDKATMDFETPEEGFLAKILTPAGSRDVPLGALLCIIVPQKEDIAAFKDYVASAAAPAVVAPKTATRPASAPTPAPASVSGSAAPSAAQPGPGGRVAASPLARSLAAQKGIDIALVRGSGPEGRITSKDVESFVPSAAAAAAPVPTPAAAAAAAAVGTAAPLPPPPPPPPGAVYTDIPLTSIRQVIARRLLQSKQTIPHYYLSVDVHMDKVLKLRKDLNELLKKENVKLSVNDFIIKAAALSCRRVPEANSSWQETFIRQYNSVDMCIAVATDTGLITPIVFQADKKGLASISLDVVSLAEKAKQGKLQPHEFQGGTFTISNLGMFGVKNFSAIINPPQACILAVGGASQTLVADESSENGYRSVSVMSVTLSCDHRVVDGAVGAKWLQQFKKFLEKPETMLL